MLSDTETVNFIYTKGKCTMGMKAFTNTTASWYPCLYYRIMKLK